MSIPTTQAGAYDILCIKDGEFNAPVEMIIHKDGPEATAATRIAWGKPTFNTDVNFFVLKNGNKITLVDTGIGAAYGPDYGHGRAVLTTAGIKPGDVTKILLTHLHTDHILGLFDNNAPYFPNATIHAPAADLAHFTSEEARAATPEAQRDAFDATTQLLALYGSKLQTFAPGPIMDSIEALPLPGHTPGHTGFLINNTVFLWADTIHLAALQLTNPDIGLIFDLDPQTAAATRAKTLAAAQNWVVGGAHITGFQRLGGVTRMRASHDAP